MSETTRDPSSHLDRCHQLDCPTCEIAIQAEFTQAEIAHDNREPDGISEVMLRLAGYPDDLARPKGEKRGFC